MGKQNSSGGLFNQSQTTRYECVNKNNFLISQLKHVVGTQKNHLNEMVLLSTQNMFNTHIFMLKTLLIWAYTVIFYWATTWDFQQCGMCDQQSLRSACTYAQSDQSLCKSLEYSTTVKVLTKHHLEFLSLKGGCTCWSESTLVKMPHCWKSHAMAQLSSVVGFTFRS